MKNEICRELTEQEVLDHLHRHEQQYKKNKIMLNTAFFFLGIVLGLIISLIMA